MVVDCITIHFLAFLELVNDGSSPPRIGILIYFQTLRPRIFYQPFERKVSIDTPNNPEEDNEDNSSCQPEQECHPVDILETYMIETKW